MKDIKFCVSIGYMHFNFDDAEEAMNFAISSKIHAVERKRSHEREDVDVSVEIIAVEENKEENKED